MFQQVSLQDEKYTKSTPCFTDNARRRRVGLVAGQPELRHGFRR
jgi:hypothetical protein